MVNIFVRVKSIKECKALKKLKYETWYNYGIQLLIRLFLVIAILPMSM